MSAYWSENFEESIEYFSRLVDSENVTILRDIVLLPSDYRRKIQEANESSHIIAALSLISVAGSKLALATRIINHGLLWDIERNHYKATKENPELLLLQEEIKCIDEQLSSFAIADDERDLLRDKRHRLEILLQKQMPFKEVVKPDIIDLARLMPDKSLIIHFQVYKTCSKMPKHPSKRWGESRYLAHFLNNNGNSWSLDIASSVELESLISEALQHTECGLDDATDSWQRLSDVLLSPMHLYLQGINKLFVILDGQLHRIPLTLLPLRSLENMLLGQAFEIAILTSVRELFVTDKPKNQSRSHGSSLVIANPDFSWSGEEISIDREYRGATRENLDALPISILKKKWHELPESETEGRSVAAILSCDCIVGKNASVELIKEVKSPLVMHVATHGYFLDECESSDECSMPRFLFDEFSEVGLPQDEVLKVSGIVLACPDCKSSFKEQSGYLTALQMTHLDLRSTELVTLSACDTGHGRIRCGEGVYGLQRALIVAGARSMLLSLWKVDDAATSFFMHRFYTLLKTGVSRLTALMAVQAEFREHENIVWRHPYYWGAWQLIGDWRPIPNL